MTPREVMTLAQGNLSRALEHKAAAADAMLHVRNTRDHLGSLRYWLTTAGELKTLKARKEHLTKALDCLIDAHRQSCREVLSGELVTARTSQSIRTAISYWQTATEVNTFADWSEVVEKFNQYCSDAMVMLDVSLTTYKIEWKSAKEAAVTARIVIARANKAMFQKVSVPKAVRKDAIKLFICKHTMIAAHDIGVMNNTNMYKLARYHHARKHVRSYGFDMTFAIWARSLVIRAMYPRC
ncbi:hypothetical protein P5_0029 [Aeromonas phage P5]|nr:hypothetical protein P5_0029 [Aeromonas phage P5]